MFPIDIVLAHESEFAVIADAEYRETGRRHSYRIAFSHVHPPIVLSDQHASAGIDVKSTRMDGARFDVLDRLLAGRPIGRIVGPEAMKLGGWQRLNAEYAKQFGVETPKW